MFKTNLDGAYNFAVLNSKALTGFGAEKSFFFYKTYSHFSLPSNGLADFYGSEIRMFFYLFFQNVRHRKVLE